MTNFQNRIKLQEPNEPVDPYPVYDPNTEPDNEPSIEPVPVEPLTPNDPLPPEPIPVYPPDVNF